MDGICASHWRQGIVCYVQMSTSVRGRFTTVSLVRENATTHSGPIPASVTKASQATYAQKVHQQLYQIHLISPGVYIAILNFYSNKNKNYIA